MFKDADIVRVAERAGLSPAEWRDIVDVQPDIVPLTPEEWREAILSTAPIAKS